MSNNRAVEYDGDSFYFAHDSARSVHDIAANAQVSLSFLGSSGVLGLGPLFVAVEGKAALIRDKDQFAAHWTKDLDRWFSQGVDTPELVLIKVHADRVHYWDGEEEDEITV